jgi:protein SCO1/2
MNKITLFVLLNLLISGCSTPEKKVKIPYYNTADFTTIWNADSVTHHIADFSFQNQAGQKVSLNTIKGKIHVANFFFTICPSLCPRLMDGMQKVAQAYAQDSSVRIMSYSVMPNRDSVAVLARYAKAKNINLPQWHLLTGDKKQIYDLARKSYFADENLGVAKDENNFLHTENFILVDSQNRIRGIYNGTLSTDIENLIADIRVLKEEEN